MWARGRRYIQSRYRFLLVQSSKGKTSNCCSLVGGRTSSIKCLGRVTHSCTRGNRFVVAFVFWTTAPALFGSIIAFMRVYQGIWECISLILWGGITRLLVVVTMRTYKGKERKCGKIFIIVLLPIVPPHPHLDLIFKLITEYERILSPAFPNISWLLIKHLSCFNSYTVWVILLFVINHETKSYDTFFPHKCHL